MIGTSATSEVKFMIDSSCGSQADTWAEAEGMGVDEHAERVKATVHANNEHNLSSFIVLSIEPE
ncbi:hypothetical protein MASR2M48_22580 [Spirochaetota bacterium]